MDNPPCDPQRSLHSFYLKCDQGMNDKQSASAQRTIISSARHNTTQPCVLNVALTGRLHLVIQHMAAEVIPSTKSALLPAKFLPIKLCHLQWRGCYRVPGAATGCQARMRQDCRLSSGNQHPAIHRLVLSVHLRRQPY